MRESNGPSFPPLTHWPKNSHPRLTCSRLTICGQAEEGRYLLWSPTAVPPPYSLGKKLVARSPLIHPLLVGLAWRRHYSCSITLWLWGLSPEVVDTMMRHCCCGGRKFGGTPASHTRSDGFGLVPLCACKAGGISPLSKWLGVGESRNSHHDVDKWATTMPDT